MDGKTILLVDDDLTLREMYGERFQEEGYQIIQATNGEEALEQIKNSKPNVILLDIMMPKVNGFDVLASLKADEATKDIPVIILTALIQESDQQLAKKLGADEYIVKSETMPGEVIAKIKALIK